MVMINTSSKDISTPSEHAFLDQAYDYLQSGEASRAKDMLFAALTRIRRHLNTREWELYLSRVCLVHPVHGLIHEDRPRTETRKGPWTHPAGTERADDTWSRANQGGGPEPQLCLLCGIADLLGES
jgi:hypothetical protein